MTEFGICVSSGNERAMQRLAAYAWASPNTFIGFLFGLGLTSTLYRMRYGNSGQLLSVARIPQFGPGFELAITSAIPTSDT